MRWSRRACTTAQPRCAVGWNRRDGPVARLDSRCTRSLSGIPSSLNLTEDLIFGQGRLSQQHATQQHATQQHASPRHASPRHASPRHASPRHASPRHASPRHASQCRAGRVLIRTTKVTHDEAAFAAAALADASAASAAGDPVPDVEPERTEPDPYDVARQIVLRQLAMVPRSRAELLQKARATRLRATRCGRCS